MLDIIIARYVELVLEINRVELVVPISLRQVINTRQFTRATHCSLSRTKII